MTQMKTSVPLAILLILLAVLGLMFISFSIEEISLEGLCVDGGGDVNLEGLMCDKSYQSLFGFNAEDTSTVMIMSLILFFGFFIIALGMILSGSRK